MPAPPLPEVFGNYAIKGIEEVLPPQPVSWWPATPGWLVLAALLLALLARWGYRRWRRWQADRYRREALARLAALGGHPGQQLEATAIILKSTALAAFPRRDVAHLSGKAWPAWLEEQGASFSDSSRVLLAEGQYRRRPEPDAEAIARLVAESTDWVRQHRGRQA
ncbi:MAG: DUF4381 domain-containing protein [Halieaceae bacterium]|nr:DUF4381 domain-containing protein [Halieaceae bacterium]